MFMQLFDAIRKKNVGYVENKITNFKIEKIKIQHLSQLLQNFYQSGQ